MNPIDPRTVIILSGAMWGLMCVVYYSLRRKYPASIHGLGEWSLAMLLFCVGGALFAARGALPDFVSIICSVLLIHLGLYIGLVGTQRLFGMQPRHPPYVLLLALVFAGEVWFLLVQPSFAARLRLSNLAMAMLFGLHARVILQQGVKSFGNVLTAGVLCLATLIQLLRFASTFALEPDSNSLSTSPQNLIYLIGFALSGLLFSISSILMASERLLCELEQLAIHDPLTNALTRRHMQQLCEGELSRCLRHGQSMALLMMDLDHFKRINDRHGHPTGDRVLVAFVGKINASLRQQDQLGRFGGEEFVALLPQTSQAEAEHVAQRICEACAVADALPVCTVSIGISTNRGASDSFEAMLSRADTAMYRSKANGRNQVAVG